MDTYDLVVIGTGPAGHFGAIQAAKLGKRVAAIELHPQLGGTCTLTGTIPSKALREATVHLTGLRQRAHYGRNYRVKDDLTVDDLTLSTSQIIRHEAGVLEAQLRRNDVELLAGKATFIGPHQIRLEHRDIVRRIRAEKILIATGSRPAHPPNIDFDGERIIDSNQILHLAMLPRTLIVVGAGVIGVEYACIFAALGVRVTLVNQRHDFLEFVDREIVETLKYHMQTLNVDFRLGEEVTEIERMGDFVVASTKSNKKLAADCLLYSIGRQGNTDGLGTETAGVTVDARGRVEVNGHYQTHVPHIYAAGDVIGFPALAATAREQGRQAMCHAFGVPSSESRSKIPYGIYSIPEISMLGPTESELTAQGVPYEIGRARYREIARGQLLGDRDGMLKILFERDTRRVLSVHIIGDGATELIHIGQAAEAFDATLDYFVEAVFNYPTLAECYKVAALDGVNRVSLLSGIIETKGHVSEELRSAVERTAAPSLIPASVHETPDDDERDDVTQTNGDPWLSEGTRKEDVVTAPAETDVEANVEADAKAGANANAEVDAEVDAEKQQASDTGAPTQELPRVQVASPRPTPSTSEAERAFADLFSDFPRLTPGKQTPPSGAQAISGAFPSLEIPRPPTREMPSIPSVEMPRPKGLSVWSRPEEPPREAEPKDRPEAADDEDEGLRHAS